MCREDLVSITRSAQEKSSERDGSSWSSEFEGLSAHGQIDTTNVDLQSLSAISWSVAEGGQVHMSL
jgi:hypothetical protein